MFLAKLSHNMLVSCYERILYKMETIISITFAETKELKIFIFKRIKDGLCNTLMHFLMQIEEDCNIKFAFRQKKYTFIIFNKVD